MAINLSPQEFSLLRQKGYSEQEINQALSDVEREGLQQSANAGRNKVDPRSSASHSSFYARSNENDVRWQLELNDILEKTEHILKGDQVGFENGIQIWKPNPEPDKNSLNKYGVQQLMKDLINYVNRHIILGDYEEKEINEKVYDYAVELTRLIFTKYEEFGMDTSDKRKEYPIIVLKMKDAVHGAYARAKHGGERRSLKEMRNINQNENIGGGAGYPININTGNQPKTRGFLNPARYLKGKYV